MTKDGDSGSGALLFDGFAIPSDFTINEGDIYVFDTSHSSMDGYSICFAGSKDNGSNDFPWFFRWRNNFWSTWSNLANDGFNSADYGDTKAELHIFLAEEQTANS